MRFGEGRLSGCLFFFQYRERQRQRLKRGNQLRDEIGVIDENAEHVFAALLQAVAGEELVFEGGQLGVGGLVLGFGGFAQAPSSLDFGNEGTLAVASKDAPPRLWRGDDTPPGRGLTGIGSPLALSFNPATGKLVTFDGNGLVLRWNNPALAYHRPTDERSWRAMRDLFDETF